MISWIAFLLVCQAPTAFADSRQDEARLGNFYTTIPLWRSGAGTNVVSVGLGSPPQDVNLTLTTNVAFIAVAGDQCQRCTEDAEKYTSDDSSSFDLTLDAVSYTSVYPSGSTDSLILTGVFGKDIITDARGDEENPRPIAVINTIRKDTTTALGGTEESFSAGSSGFWGLGIFSQRPANSILPSMLTVTTDGRPSDATYYTVGIDVGNHSNEANSQAGTIHWGGVPSGAYQGNFAWLNVDTEVAGGWGFGLNRIRVGSSVVDTSSYYTLALYAAVPEASRDASDRTRWNIPCDANISMTVTISGHEYNVASSELVQPRDRAARTCWGSLVAWQNQSLPEQLGEIRLGTPFLSGVYAALYYSPGERFVGIAGKPGTVNALDVSRGNGGGKPNLKLAGILIGTLLGVLLIVLLLCYSRNRNSFQSIWYRAVRRQHRFQTNAMVRAATLPPPIMLPPTAPLMGRPFGPPLGPMGPMGPYGRPMMPVPPSNMIWGPPAYLPPIQPQVPTQQQPNQPGQGVQHQQQSQRLPPVLEHQPQGFYAQRRHPGSIVSPQQITANPAQIPSGPSRHHRSQSLQYQGISHPAAQQHQQQTAQMSPDSGGSRSVKWGPVKAKHASYPAGSSAARYDLATNFPRRVSNGAGDRATRHDAWVQQYSGPGQDQQPYPIHKTPQPPAQPEAAHQVSQTFTESKEKKRPFSWAKRSKGGSKAGYSPVNMAYVDHGAMEPGAKRRSWFGRGVGSIISETERSKRAEREREREALARRHPSSALIV